MAEKTPWAILLCKWKGTTAEPRTLDFFRRLFTPVGVGSFNMVDFFDQMSHGAIDVSGSQVLGWYTLDKPQSDYVGNAAVVPAGKIDRGGLVDLARKAATDAKVDLSKFYGVVVCMNTLTDLFGGDRRAVCDPGSFRPTVLGQEMGHGYGLAHSKLEGSAADYMDPWDVMSTWDSCHISAHAEYAEIGPGLNAANMRGRGWLDETRVWFAPTGSFSRQVTLRPLHRRGLSGFLAAEALGLYGARYLFEFRNQTGWDAAIPRPAVLVHRFEGNQSYLMPSASGANDLIAGDRFIDGEPTKPLGLQVNVEAIDPAGETATLRFEYQMPTFAPPERHREPVRLHDGILGGDGIVLGGGKVDGGGYVIIGGRIIRIPPWNPMARLLEQIAVYQAADLMTDSGLQHQIRHAAVHTMHRKLEALAADEDVFHSPAPSTRAQRKPPKDRPKPRKK